VKVPRKILVDHDDTKAEPFRVVGLDMQWGDLRFPGIVALSTWLSKHDYRYVLDTCGLWVLP
jgi:hypothetical protein